MACPPLCGGLRPGAAGAASWTGPRAAGAASGTCPRAAERPRLCRGAFGTRGPVPFHFAVALRPGAAGVFRGKMVTLARWGRAGSILAGRKAFPAPEWRNWQTRKIQVLVQVTGWRFKSSLGHSAAASLPLRGTLPLRRRCVATEGCCGTAHSGAAGVFGRRSVGTRPAFCGGRGFSTRFSAASGSQQRWQHGRVDPLGLRGRIVPGP